LSKWKQRDRCHSARKRVGNGRNCGNVGGTGEEEPARRFIAIHAFLDCQHKFRHPLNFIDHSAFKTSDKTDGIRTRGTQGACIIERDVRSVGSGNCRARVVFPACRGPTIRTTRVSVSAVSTSGRMRRSIICRGDAEVAMRTFLTKSSSNLKYKSVQSELYF